jgi:hypothetical protein
MSGKLTNSVDLKEIFSGVFMIAIAAAFAWIILKPTGGLSLGSARSMGPGYFPLMVTALLAALGLLLVAHGFARGTDEISLVSLRSLLLVLLAPVAFALLVRPLGFIIAVATLVMIAAWSSMRMTLSLAIYTTIGMTIFSTVLFYYVLKMPVTLLGDGSILPIIF